MKTNNFIIRYRFWFIIAPVIITLLMALPLRNAKINPDLMDYLPDDIEAKIKLDTIESIFGKYDPVIIIFKADDVLNPATLKRIGDLNNHFSRMREFDDVISLFETKYIRGKHGMMLVDPVVRRIPATDKEKENLRNEVKNNELAYKLFVSEDFNYTLMILNPVEEIEDFEVFELINDGLEKFPGDEIVYMNGLPYLRDEIQKIATRDISLLFPLGMLVMLAFLYFSFRQFRSVLLPFSVVLMSIVVAMGMMPLLGYEFSIIAVLVPIMIIAIANNYGVHIVARYQELNDKKPEWNIKQIASRLISLLSIPIILSAVTTIVGILGLSVHILIPARQMGIVTSIGIAYSLILSLTFIPALMSYMKKGKSFKQINGNKTPVIEKLLAYTSRLVTKHPRSVIAAFAVACIIATLGAFNLNVNINLEEMLPRAHEMRTSTNIANEHFGGTKNTSILFEGDIIDPDVMHNIYEFESGLKNIPEVGNTTSIASVLKIISRALNDPGDEFYDTIPDNRAAIAQYIELYNMSGDPEDFEKLVDFGYTSAVLNVQFKAEDIEVFNRITSHIDNLIEKTPYATMQAGQTLMEKEIAESIVRGQIYSLLFALVAIAILLWVIFRSIKAGMLGSLPLLICLLCNFGLMGWLGLELDIATSLLSTIAIGIGVDYTIHLFWRLKFEHSNGKTHADAVITALTTTGRGIAINGFSVLVGFAVLFFSGLIILKTFAFLIIFSILLCMLGALFLIPAIYVLTKPKFLDYNNSK